MVGLDSNAVIYLTNNRSFDNNFKGVELSCSVVAKIEVLGYHKIAEKKRIELEAFFDAIFVIDLKEEIATEARRLRQIRNISLGDSIIAATALIYKTSLVTANADDFKWIAGLEILNPFENI